MTKYDLEDGMDREGRVKNKSSKNNFYCELGVNALAERDEDEREESQEVE